MLQWWGQHRRLQYPDYWLDKVVEDLEEYEGSTCLIVITDARYLNELSWMRRTYPTTYIKLTGEGYGHDDHISEQEWKPWGQWDLEFLIATNAPPEVTVGISRAALEHIEK